MHKMQHCQQHNSSKPGLRQQRQRQQQQQRHQ